MKTIKILCNSKKRIICNSYTYILLLFTAIAEVVVWFFNIQLNKINMESFISVSITGLSFTLALLVATKNTFDKKELAQLLQMSKMNKHKTVFSDIFAPFIWTSILWLISGIISTIIMLFPFNQIINQKIVNFFTIIYCSLIILSIINLFMIIIDNINDLINHAILIWYKNNRK